MKKRSFLLATFVAASVVLLGVSGPAQAAPTGCTTGATGYTAGAYCESGTGQFRAKTRCNKPWAPDYARYGEWMGVGTWTSFAKCDNGHLAFNPTWETR
ncbi:hypothetical protein [Micromonospora sp. WMMD812]|uniref:hypothetical protein n=1 Tax=Micromonospora sp. WMMD812 TaxID=3015152 RepID=UPI00248D24E6|nr:hypothetical protein [Micromonospora sp. WMMD812]WBB65510.1 hypothetical protein O7603_20150 [Micromonospora sp. WMMD812]